MLYYNSEEGVPCDICVTCEPMQASSSAPLKWTDIKYERGQHVMPIKWSLTLSWIWWAAINRRHKLYINPTAVVSGKISSLLVKTSPWWSLSPQERCQLMMFLLTCEIRLYSQTASEALGLLALKVKQHRVRRHRSHPWTLKKPGRGGGRENETADVRSCIWGCSFYRF